MESLRILVKPQSELWSEGLSVARMFAKQKTLVAANQTVDTDDEDEESTEEEGSRGSGQSGQSSLPTNQSEYGGGKWGRYLRAPDFYFEVMRRFGERFTRLGEIATIKAGIKSGCDDYFMPRNVSAEFLAKYQNEEEWKTLPLMRRCKRSEIESGEVILVQCGDNTLHPIESKYVKPEVHNLMSVTSPLVSSNQLERVVLWVSQELKKIKGTYAYHFIVWGSKQTFSSNKSKNVPIPERPTCRSRKVWYDLTATQPGIGFWPEGQQYRHIVPANPEGIVCNHKLFDIHLLLQSKIIERAFVPLINSTLVAFLKTFYGRYAGTEGNLQTAVFDTLLLEIPDPRNVTERLLHQLETAFASIQRREVTHLVEESFLKCHTADEVREAAKLPLGLPIELKQADRRELDYAVFELLGVTDSQNRSNLVDQLYSEITQHFRAIRIVEVQKMEQRRQSDRMTVSANQLALDAWEELEPQLQQPLLDWLATQTDQTKSIELLEGEPELPDANNFFEATTVYFGKKSRSHLVCDSRAEAELVFSIAQTGVHGKILLPTKEEETHRVLRDLNSRLAHGYARLADLAESRTGTDKMYEQVFDLLRRWFIYGRPQ